MLRAGTACLALQRRLASQATAVAASSTQSTLALRQGDVLADGSWTVRRTQTLPDLGIAAVEMKHVHSAAKFLHLAPIDDVSDPTNVFSVAFRTTPSDSTGVSHILEHVTLCGSQKYPVRDPFFKMLSRSLSTFMNAMTGPDYTLYPFATTNEKDFHNLLSVYLDAVFRPQLRQLDFCQEGWRLEHENPSDPSSKLMIKGVVFNEMKGVFADAQQHFGRSLLSAVLPSNTYGVCSGGLPENIPDLTWHDLKAFHARHYSPHNAKFYSYGTLPVESILEKVNQYLPTKFEQVPEVPLVPSEPRWTKPRSKEIACAPDPSSPDALTVSVSYLTNDVNDSYESFVMGILNELLTGGANAPFYKSLLEPGLGTGFAPSTGYESQTKDTFFVIGLQGVASENKDVVLKAIKDTFDEVIANGFDPRRIEAIIHQTELSLKNKGSGFGLNLIMSLTSLWNNDPDDLTQHLQINRNIEKFKKELASNPKYLQEKVQQYFVDNTHQLTLTMKPSDKYTAEQEELLSEVEQRLVSKLSESDIAALHQQGEALACIQSVKEDLSCLPTLKVEDIASETPLYAFDTLKLQTVPTQLSVQPTNGVAFFRALLDIQDLPNHLREALPIFVNVLTSLGAGAFDFRQMDTEIELRSGGFSASAHIWETPSNDLDVRQSLLLTSYCLQHNSDRMLELWSSIFNDLHVRNQERLRTLLNMLSSDATNSLAYRGHSYAMSSAASRLRPGPELRERLQGISHVQRLARLSQSNSLEELIEHLGQLAAIVFSKERMKIALNTTPNHADGFLKAAESFILTLPNTTNKQSTTPSTSFVDGGKTATHKHYFKAPFPVHFCSLAVPAVPYLHEDFAALRITAALLSRKFLHGEIREKGGAYGAGATTDGSGVFSFYSYRDPTSQATLDTFQRSNEWLQAVDSFSQQDVDEAKLNVFQKLDAPVVPGDRGLREFLSGVSHDMFQAHREALRNTSAGDVRRVASQYLNDRTEKSITVIGPDQKTVDSSWQSSNVV